MGVVAFMGAKGGDDHHLAVKLRADKATVLQKVRGGLPFDAAFALVGRNPRTAEKWLLDKKFAADLDAALVEGKAAMAAAFSNGDKQAIDYATFSREFLGLEVFPHQQNWIDVLEGREPSWIDPAMTYEPAESNRLLVNVPPEHAKSTVMTVGYATYLICMNPNIRIVIVSQTQTRAKEFLYSIKERLTDERWAKLQQVYGPPGGWKATADQWQQDRIYLDRSSGEKDPTVQALGIKQQIYGTRADVIIIDDPIGTTNAHEYEKQLEWLQKMVITRVGKFGKILVVGTRVSPIDLYKEIRNPDRWGGNKSPFTYLAMPAVLEFHDDKNKWRTLWPASDQPWDGDPDPQPDENGLYSKWDGPALHRRRSEVTASTWAMVYQQQDVEDDSVFPAEAIVGSVNRMRKIGPINFGAPGHPRDGNWVTLIGLDPAMVGRSAAIVYAIERETGRRMVLDVFNMSDPTPQKIFDLLESWITRYSPMELIVEINAYQKSYALDTEFNQWLSSRGVRMRQHFTGNNKWDVGFGVASMAGLFGSLRDGEHQDDNILELPDNSNEHVKALINQLITWKADTRGPTDCVMALWFCELRAKELVRLNMHKRSHVTNRFATRRNLEMQGSVSINEMMAENYYV